MSHVYLVRPPATSAAYVHAAGRCGRVGSDPSLGAGGRRPSCTTLVADGDADRFRALADAALGEGGRDRVVEVDCPAPPKLSLSRDDGGPGGGVKRVLGAHVWYTERANPTSPLAPSRARSRLASRQDLVNWFMLPTRFTKILDRLRLRGVVVITFA